MTVTQNYGNIILSTPILSADPNVKEDVMTDQQKITILVVINYSCNIGG